MPMVAEIAAFIFKLEKHTLPLAGSDLALGLAIGKTLLHGFDDVAEFSGDHPKEQHDGLFVDGFMTQPAEVYGVAVKSGICCA